MVKRFLEPELIRALLVFSVCFFMIRWGEQQLITLSFGLLLYPFFYFIIVVLTNYETFNLLNKNGNLLSSIFVFVQVSFLMMLVFRTFILPFNLSVICLFSIIIGVLMSFIIILKKYKCNKNFA